MTRKVMAMAVSEVLESLVMIRSRLYLLFPSPNLPSIPHSALQKVAQVNYIDGQLKFMILTIRYQCKTKLWIHKVELLSVFKSYFNNNI